MGKNIVNQSYSDIMLNASQNLIDRALANQPYDRTEICEIVDDSKADQGIYIVKLNNLNTEVYGEVLKYAKGDYIRLQIPNGDYNEKKYIQGIYKYEGQGYYHTSGSNVIPLLKFNSDKIHGYELILNRMVDESIDSNAYPEIVNRYAFEDGKISKRILKFDLSNKNYEEVKKASVGTVFIYNKDGFELLFKYNNEELFYNNNLPFEIFLDKTEGFAAVYIITSVLENDYKYTIAFLNSTIHIDKEQAEYLGYLVSIENIPNILLKTKDELKPEARVGFIDGQGEILKYCYYNALTKEYLYCYKDPVNDEGKPFIDYKSSGYINNIPFFNPINTRLFEEAQKYTLTAQPLIPNLSYSININQINQGVNHFDTMLFVFDIEGYLQLEDEFIFEFVTEEDFQLSSNQLIFYGKDFFGKQVYYYKELEDDTIETYAYKDYSLLSRLLIDLKIPTYIKGSLQGISIYFHKQRDIDIIQIEEGIGNLIDNTVLSKNIATNLTLSNCELILGHKMVNSQQNTMHIWSNEENILLHTPIEINGIWYNQNEKEQYIGFSDCDTTAFDYIKNQKVKVKTIINNNIFLDDINFTWDNEMSYSLKFAPGTIISLPHRYPDSKKCTIENDIGVFKYFHLPAIINVNDVGYYEFVEFKGIEVNVYKEKDIYKDNKQPVTVSKLYLRKSFDNNGQLKDWYDIGINNPPTLLDENYYVELKLSEVILCNVIPTEQPKVLKAIDSNVQHNDEFGVIQSEIVLEEIIESEEIGTESKLLMPYYQYSENEYQRLSKDFTTMAAYQKQLEKIEENNKIVGYKAKFLTKKTQQDNGNYDIEETTIKLKGDDSSLRLAFGLQTLLNATGGLTESNPYGNPIGGLIDQYYWIMQVLSFRQDKNVIQETEKWISGGEEILRLITLFSYWTDLAFNRESFKDRVNSRISNYDSGLLQVYNSYYNILTGKSILKYKNCDCYCQSYCYDPTGYNMYQEWCLRDCLINSSTVLKDLIYYIGFFSQQKWMVSYIEAVPLLEKYLNNLNELILTLDNIWQIHEEPDDFLNLKDVPGNGLENNSTVEGLIDDGLQARQIDINTLELWNINDFAHYAQYEASLDLKNTHTWLEIDKENKYKATFLMNEYIKIYKTFIITELKKSNNKLFINELTDKEIWEDRRYDIKCYIKRTDSSVPNTVIQRYVNKTFKEILSIDMKIPITDFYDSYDYTIVINVFNPNIYTSRNHAHVDIYNQKIKGFTINLTQGEFLPLWTDNINNYLIYYTIYNTNENNGSWNINYNSFTGFTGIVDIVINDPENFILEMPYGNDFKNNERYGIYLEFYRKHIDPLVVHKGSLRGGNLNLNMIKGYFCLDISENSRYIDHYSIPYLDEIEAVPGTDNERTGQYLLGFAYFRSDWMSPLSGKARVADFHIQFNKKIVSNPYFFDVLNNYNILEPTNYEVDLEDCHNKYNIEWYIYNKDTDVIDAEFGKGWIKLNYLNLGLPKIKENRALEISDIQYFNLLKDKFIVDTSGEYKIKAVVYYNHEKYISNEIIINIETVSEKAGRLRRDMDIQEWLDESENISTMSLRSRVVAPIETSVVNNKKITFHKYNKSGLQTSSVSASEYYIIDPETGVEVPLLEFLSGTAAVIKGNNTLKAVENDVIGW